MDDSCRSDENEVYDNIDTTGNRTVSREENMARALEDSVAPKKKKRVSKKTELENKLSSLETRFDDKFNKLFELFQDRSSALGTRDTVISQPGGLATQQENVSMDNVSIGERRPILSLDPNLDEMLGSPKISRNIDIDTRSEISLQPDSCERADLLGLCSSDDESQSSINTAHMTQSNSKTKNIDRFSRYLNVQSTASATQPDMGQCSSSKSTDNSIKYTCTNLNVLSKIFTIDSDQSGGLLLDEAQIKLLANLWRSKTPERFTCFREDYRNCFPIHKNAVDFLQVPSLDEILEPMIRTLHGPKAVKNWDKQKQLFTQPLKQIEKLAFQGQVAARMGIISILYLQNALASLSSSIKSDNTNPDILQSVNDIFAISMKSLDQFGITGAFNHIIRRKAATSESGLNTLKDIQAKVLYLPLTAEGVFGEGLEDKLGKRKEQREQLKELLPEFSNKRKPDFNTRQDTWPNKTPRYSVNNNMNTNNNLSNNSRRSGFSVSKPTSKFTPRYQQKFAEGRDSDKKENTFKDKKSGSCWGSSFRIPKKNNS